MSGRFVGSWCSIVLAGTLLAAPLAQPPPTPPPAPPGQPAPPPQPSEITLTIGERTGVPPRLAVPEFLALTPDPETVEVARLLSEVLWRDLEFEREFYMIPRDTYATIPRARSVDEVPLDRWRELGADGVVIGAVRRVPEGLQVQVRLFHVRAQQSVFGREYRGSATNPRLYAHTIADEIHQTQRGLRGVARTKIAFVSDRDSARLTDGVPSRPTKEIYIADYDGENQRRLTVDRNLALTPAWSPDGRALAYTSYRRGYPDIFVSFIYDGRLEAPARDGPGVHNFLPAWSPDGTRIAFMSNRDGNPEIYVIDRDGRNLRRLTFHPGIDVSPTWSPTGTQIAFTSDRSGSPQIYVIGADGAGLRRVTYETYCDRPSWSPPPFNEIAYASRTGPGYDIKILDVASGQVRQITFGEGSNESPAFAPNGRHLAFSSTRSGRKQIFTIARDGRDLRQITRAGNNEMPHWSQ